MTSVGREIGGRGNLGETAEAVQESFVAVFGYERVAEANAQALWARVDRTAIACEAQAQV
jgi:hypothetical protein